jgi:hypothetical protein
MREHKKVRENRVKNKRIYFVDRNFLQILKTNKKKEAGN